MFSHILRVGEGNTMKDKMTKVIGEDFVPRTRKLKVY